MGSAFRPLPVETVAAALAALPNAQSSDAGVLNPVRIALARAIASGQDIQQLTQDLSAPSTWLGVDLKTVTGTPPAAAARIQAAITPPDWALAAAKSAVEATSALRVAVLDRDPAAITSLNLPTWAIGQKASATYGPISIENTAAQLTVQKWINIYLIPVQMVSFVSGSTTLFVAPFAATGSAKSITLAAGSVWLNVASFASGTPANSFAGIAEQGGSITCDQALALGGTTVTVPAGATLTLTVIPAPSGTSIPVAKVAQPAVMTFAYPNAKPATATIGNFTAAVYGETFDCKQNGQPPVYNDVTKTLAFPCSTNQTQFSAVTQTSTLLKLSGRAPLEAAGWALQVAQSAPTALGNAANSGLIYLGCGAGIFAQWTGLIRPEPEAGAIVLASNGSLLLWTAAGLAPNTLSQLKFKLWNAQQTASAMTATRLAGSGLVYEITGTHELIELGATLSADLDRPLYADGSRVPLAIPNGLVYFTSAAAKQRVFAYAAFPAAEIPKILALNPQGFPMALDNAFLMVSVPLLFVMEATIAKTQPDGTYVSSLGALLVGFIYKLEFPFLPDPYTGPFLNLEDNSARGGLFAEVGWTAQGKVALRLIDVQHPHPAQPPANEASSDLTPTPSPIQIAPGTFQLGLADASLQPVTPITFPFQPVTPVPSTPVATMPIGATSLATQGMVGPLATAGPQPIPVPPPAAGLAMLDVSTRASQFGVEIVDYNLRTAQTLLTIDGLSARTYAVLAPVITLPAVSWEPMYNKAAPVSGSPTDRLLHPPDDGPICGLGVDSVTLVPISPIQSLNAILTGTQTEGSVYGGILTLPYGMVAGILQMVGSKGGPAPQLTQPSFDVPDTSGGDVTLTGAYQLTLRPPATNPNAPLFTGKTYLRTQGDNPPGALSYGEEVLGLDVGSIFSTQFNNPGSGVPLKRYDLTGYGASLATDWTNLNPPDPTAIIQVNFVTPIGRTSHEVVQAQSVIYPWGIKVVRTITIDRLNSGSVERTDSGWIAASDGNFTITTPMNDFTAADVHAGVIESLLQVRNIHEFGLPLPAQGTFDYDITKPLPPGINPEPQHGPVSLQPVTFDADIAINPQHAVLQGGSEVTGLDGKKHPAVPSTGMIGYIGLTALYHLSLTDLLNFLDTLPQPAGGPLHATLNLGKSNNVFRSVAISADPVQDTTLTKSALAISMRGLPTLPSGSAWTVALKKAADTAPRSLPPTQPVPVVQLNASPGVPSGETHFADPADLFRLAPSPPTPPANLYGFLQDVTTQKTFLAQPFITNGTAQLSLRQVPSLADPGILLGAVSSFPTIASALPLSGLQNLASKLGAQSLAIDKWFDTDPNKVTHLIQTSVAVVDLVYRWNPSGPKPAQPNPSDPNAMIHVTLGQPTGPTWSIDIYEVALKLFIPPVDASTPALWIEGSFHADSESLPNFPDLQVVYDGPLAPLTKFFTTLQKLGDFLGGGSASPEMITPHDTGNGSSGLNVHFADGTLTIQDTFPLPQIPLGPGYIEDISLDLGASIDILNLDVGFLVGIGSPDAPVHWIVDPLSGTGCLQAGVQGGQLAVLVQLGIGLGLAIDLGIASGGASIVIAFQVQVSGQQFELMLLLTGQAQVTVLGGLASASISLSCGLGLEFPLALPPSGDFPVTAIGTASVGIHISICWVISIDFSGSWSFSHTFEVPV